MPLFCKYRHIFGKEGEGVHSYRVMNIAIIDLGFTVLGALVIAMFFRVSFVETLIALLLLALLVHWLFCVDTTFTRFVFGEKFVGHEEKT